MIRKKFLSLQQIIYNDEQEPVYHQRLQWCWQNDSIIYRITHYWAIFDNSETPRKNIAVGGKSSDVEIFYSALYENILSYVK